VSSTTPLAPGRVDFRPRRVAGSRAAAAVTARHVGTPGAEHRTPPAARDRARQSSMAWPPSRRSVALRNAVGSTSKVIVRTEPSQNTAPKPEGWALPKA
jgi:hypothetical protein